MTDQIDIDELIERLGKNQCRENMGCGTMPMCACADMEDAIAALRQQQEEIAERKVLQSITREEADAAHRCLSAPLPDEVADCLEFLKTISYGKSHPVSTALFESIDLIERLARNKAQRIQEMK